MSSIFRGRQIGYSRAQPVEQTRFVHIVAIPERVHRTYFLNLIHALFVAVRNCRTTPPMQSYRTLNASSSHKVFDVSVTGLEFVIPFVMTVVNACFCMSSRVTGKPMLLAKVIKASNSTSTSGYLAYSSFLVFISRPFFPWVCRISFLCIIRRKVRGEIENSSWISCRGVPDSARNMTFSLSPTSRYRRASLVEENFVILLRWDTIWWTVSTLQPTDSDIDEFNRPLWDRVRVSSLSLQLNFLFSPSMLETIT